MNQFSIVIVIKRFTYDGVDNLERFCKVGMTTYNAFLDVESVKDFIVICPSNELHHTSDILKMTYPQWSWRFIPEDKLVDKSLPSGWMRQQTAKLAISMLVTTNHYLIIDDDTYLTRPFSYSNLFDSDGKVIFSKTPIDFPFFFLWSNQVLQYDMEVVQSEQYHMSITPEIFVTSEVRNLVRWLVSTYGDNKQWQRFLADHKYTEYCLYWIWLIKHNKHKALYSTDETAPSTYGYATSSTDHSMSDNVRMSFDLGKPHFFSFIQSSLKYPIDDVTDEVLQHIKI